MKRRVYDSCILPVTPYWLDTMTYTEKKTAEQLRVTQKSIERGMLGINLKDKIANSVISKQRTKVIDVMKMVV